MAHARGGGEDLEPRRTRGFPKTRDFVRVGKNWLTRLRDLASDELRGTWQHAADNSPSRFRPALRAGRDRCSREGRSVANHYSGADYCCAEPVSMGWHRLRCQRVAVALGGARRRRSGTRTQSQLGASAQTSAIAIPRKITACAATEGLEKLK